MRRKYWIILIAVCLVCISGLLLACTDSDKNKEKDDLKMSGNGEILISVFWPPMKGFTTAEQYDLLASNGMLVKRPLLIDSGKVLVGFKETEWEAALHV